MLLLLLLLFVLLLILLSCCSAVCPAGSVPAVADCHGATVSVADASAAAAVSTPVIFSSVAAEPEREPVSSKNLSIARPVHIWSYISEEGHQK